MLPGMAQQVDRPAPEGWARGGPPDGCAPVVAVSGDLEVGMDDQGVRASADELKRWDVRLSSCRIAMMTPALRRPRTMAAWSRSPVKRSRTCCSLSNGSASTRWRAPMRCGVVAALATGPAPNVGTDCAAAPARWTPQRPSCRERRGRGRPQRRGLPRFRACTGENADRRKGADESTEGRPGAGSRPHMTPALEGQGHDPLVSAVPVLPQDSSPPMCWLRPGSAPGQYSSLTTIMAQTVPAGGPPTFEDATPESRRDPPVRPDVGGQSYGPDAAVWFDAQEKHHRAADQALDDRQEGEFLGVVTKRAVDRTGGQVGDVEVVPGDAASVEVQHVPARPGVDLPPTGRALAGGRRRHGRGSEDVDERVPTAAGWTQPRGESSVIAPSCMSVPTDLRPGRRWHRSSDGHHPRVMREQSQRGAVKGPLFGSSTSLFDRIATGCPSRTFRTCARPHRPAEGPSPFTQGSPWQRDPLQHRTHRAAPTRSVRLART